MRGLRWVTVLVVIAACSGGDGATTTTTSRPVTTTSTAMTTTTTTTAPEHETVRALRAYFDAYAVAVQTKNPDSILPSLDMESPEVIESVISSIRRDIDSGDSGKRLISSALIEFDRVNEQGQRIVSVRTTFAFDTGATAQSYGFVSMQGRWLLTAIDPEGFR